MFGAKGSEFGKKSNQDHNASPFYVSQSKPSGFSSSGLFQQSNPSFSSPPQGLFSVPVTAAPRFGFKADDSLPTSQPATAAPRFGFKKDDSLPTFQRFGAENSSTDNSDHQQKSLFQTFPRKDPRVKQSNLPAEGIFSSSTNKSEFFGAKPTKSTAVGSHAGFGASVPSAESSRKRLSDVKDEEQSSKKKLFGEPQESHSMPDKTRNKTGVFGKIYRPPASRTGRERKLSQSTGPSPEMFRETHKPLSGRASRKVERNPLISDRSSDTTAPALRLVRRPSSSSANLSSSLQCTQIPKEFNDKENLRRHFSKFGKVLRVRPTPNQNFATVTFSVSDEAALAKEKGKMYYGRPIHIYFVKPRKPSSSDKSPMQMEQKAVEPSKIAPKQKTSIRRTNPRASNISALKSVQAKSDGEKLAILDKIDKALRSRTIKQSDLSKATVAIGTCPDMCPEKERYLRTQKNLLAFYEMGEGRRVDHSLAVKEYSRSSADQEEPLPHELRPSRVLRITMDYMLTHVMREIDYEKTAEWYDFVWNRTRAIRKEISIQQLNDPIAIEVIEECARFHMCCAHELCEADLTNFDPKINNENLEKTMKTLLDTYQHVRLHNPDYFPPNEAEFQSYFILLNINRTSDVLSSVKTMRPDVRYSNEVRLAVNAFLSVHSNNYARFFSIVGQASYLQASLMHRYFSQVRQTAMRVMAKAYSTKQQCFIFCEDVIRRLHFNDFSELETFCMDHEITFENRQICLQRGRNYTAETVSLFCSREISMKMQGVDIGTIVAHGRQPSSAIHQPTSSFDQDGYYIGPHASLLSSSFTSAPVQEVPDPSARSSSPDFDPAYLTEIMKRKRISNVVIKSVARDLFADVISVSAQEICSEELIPQLRHVLAEPVSTDILFEVIESCLKETVSNQILAEKVEEERKRREAEIAEQKERERMLALLERERKRKEEEERKKAKLESIARSTASIAGEIENEVVANIIQETAFQTHRTTFIKNFSTKYCGEIVECVSHDELKNIVSTAIKNERREKNARLINKFQTTLTEIRWKKWRRELNKVKMYKLACQLFPCTSRSRDIHQQIRELTEAKDPDKYVVPPKRLLSLESMERSFTTHRDLHDDVIKRIDVVDAVHYDVIAMNEIVRERLQMNTDTDLAGVNEHAFWKVSFATPDRHSDWLIWIEHKLGFRQKSSPNHKNIFLQESSSAVAPKHICVCCKRIDDHSSYESDLCGTSALVVLFTSKDKGQCKVFIENLFASLRPLPPVPVLILTCGFDGGVLSKELELFTCIGISSINILNFGSEDFVQNCNKLKAGIGWLVDESEFNLDIRSLPLRDFVEEGIMQYYMTPIFKQIGQLPFHDTPILDPHFVIEMYNKILNDLSSCLRQSTLLKMSWPAPEFAQLGCKGTFSLPRHGWNTAEQFDNLEKLFENIKLPEMPDFFLCSDVGEVENDLIGYICKVCPKHGHLAVAIVHAIQSYDGDIEDVEGFINSFSWLRVINTIASALIEDVLYTEEGERIVAYFESSLKNVKLPQQCMSLFDQLGFDGLDKPAAHQLSSSELTSHSMSYGAHANLTKVIEKEQSLNQSSSAFDWLKSDDVTQSAASEATDLRNKIRMEAEESARFEKELQRIVENGELHFS